jgi:hypothetical protein
MGSSPRAKSTRHSAKTTAGPPPLNPGTTTQRTAHRRSVPDVGVSPHVSAQAPAESPSLACPGKEIRRIAKRLAIVESYVIVCRMALDGQGSEQDADVAVLLRRGVGDLLFQEIQTLTLLASKFAPDVSGMNTGVLDGEADGEVSLEGTGRGQQK